MHKQAEEPAKADWRQRRHEVVFEAETLSGKVFDVALLWLIILSVAVVVLERVRSLRAEYGSLFLRVEWALTILFTVEYILRLISVRRPAR